MSGVNVKRGDGTIVRSNRSYVGELEWTISKIGLAFNDRNPERADGIARRSRECLPERPTMSGQAKGGAS